MCEASFVPPEQPVLSILVRIVESKQLAVMHYNIVKLDDNLPPTPIQAPIHAPAPMSTPTPTPAPAPVTPCPHPYPYPTPTANPNAFLVLSYLPRCPD